MAFKVIKSGILTLIQDLGRYGYQHIGVTTGGPMDEYAFRCGNALLKNNENAAQLEITFGSLTLEAQEATSIAITGADLGATLNDNSILPWQTYAINKGDILSFNQPVFGLRAYLAVKGGFHVSPLLGSVSTVPRESLGGLTGKGNKLEKGDILPFTPTTSHKQSILPRHAMPNYDEQRIPMVLSYQFTRLSGQDRARFFANEYTVTPQSDRMGYRLSGEPIGGERKGIVSEGIAYGAIQVPNDGQPIVLLRDRQTIGGYPKLGCVTTLGGGLIAQKKPGDTIYFQCLTIGHAERDWQQKMTKLAAFY